MKNGNPPKMVTISHPDATMIRTWLYCGSSAFLNLSDISEPSMKMTKADRINPASEYHSEYINTYNRRN